MAERLKLDVEEYLAELLELVAPIADVDVVPVADAQGRTLALPVVAAGNVPAMANSAMDGFALRASELRVGAVLQVMADVPAGSPLDPRLGPGECCRIMTGAPMPSDADTVVPVESTDDDRELVTVRERPAAQGAFVRRSGAALAAGVQVVAAGALVTEGVLAPQEYSMKQLAA